MVNTTAIFKMKNLRCVHPREELQHPLCSWPHLYEGNSFSLKGHFKCLWVDIHIRDLCLTHILLSTEYFFIQQLDFQNISNIIIPIPNVATEASKD